MEFEMKKTVILLMLALLILAFCSCDLGGNGGEGIIDAGNRFEKDETTEDLTDAEKPVPEAPAETEVPEDIPGIPETDLPLYTAAPVDTTAEPAVTEAPETVGDTEIPDVPATTAAPVTTAPVETTPPVTAYTPPPASPNYGVVDTEATTAPVPPPVTVAPETTAPAPETTAPAPETTVPAPETTVPADTSNDLEPDMSESDGAVDLPLMPF